MNEWTCVACKDLTACMRDYHFVKGKAVDGPGLYCDECWRELNGGRIRFGNIETMPTRGLENLVPRQRSGRKSTSS